MNARSAGSSTASASFGIACSAGSSSTMRARIRTMSASAQ
jgi:hypothetical protein